MKRLPPRVMIAGTGSGCGKTTVTCALIGALLRKGTRLAAFKCGPDYIDPMFHQRILGVPSRNLDLFLSDETAVRQSLANHSPKDSLAIIEGVMGFYDGISGTDQASSAHLARVAGTPVILVVNARGKALSIAAEIQGYQRFGPGQIQGVILNQASEKSYAMLKKLVDKHCGIKVLGYLPQVPEAAISSRHLGLMTPDEIKDLRQKLDTLTETALQTLELDPILELARTAAMDLVDDCIKPKRQYPVRIGVAKDSAFCFYYEENLELLRARGAELCFFSPMQDTALPENLDGLYLCGGYPEVYAGALSRNQSMRDAVKSAALSGVPTIAECGGFLYLCKELITRDEAVHPMAGVLPISARMTGRLQHFGYGWITATNDNLLCKKNEKIAVHEYHYSHTDQGGSNFTFQKPDGTGTRACVYATDTLWAGYPHLYFAGNPQIAERFLSACYRRKVS